VLRRTWIDVDRDPLTAPSQAWESVTSYVVTRHARLGDASAALAANLAAECQRRGYPEPRCVEALEARGMACTGLVGRARLTFQAAVSGPILLGRSRYMGGGLFARC
jgi:hypothetical protein